MKKLFAICVFASVNLFPSMPDSTSMLECLARWPLLVHFVKEADKVQKPEIKTYIGTYLFGSDWEKEHLSVAQEVVSKNLITVSAPIQATAQFIVIDAMMLKAQSENRLDVVNFIKEHQNI